MQLIIEEANIRYGSVLALAVQNLALRPGVTGLVGLNGAGKSTLLTGLASAGVSPVMRISTDGNPVTTRASRRALLTATSLMPQSFELPARFTVVQILTYLAWLRGVPSSAAGAAVDEVLAAVDLSDRARVKIGSLSGGMVRRVGLAQALLNSPSVLLLDEPTAGLDPEQRVIFRDLLVSLPATASTVVSSHLMEDVLRVADQILMLHEGAVVFHGAVEEFWAAAAARGVTNRNDPELAFLSLTRMTEPS